MVPSICAEHMSGEAKLFRADNRIQCRTYLCAEYACAEGNKIFEIGAEHAVPKFIGAEVSFALIFSANIASNS